MPFSVPKLSDSGAGTESSAIQKTEQAQDLQNPESAQETQVVRIVTVVCPSRELSYPISLISKLGVDTVTADFGRFSGDDILKSSAKWIDLSDSETIWKE